MTVICKKRMSNENCRPERRQLRCYLQVQVVMLPSGKRREDIKILLLVLPVRKCERGMHHGVE